MNPLEKALNEIARLLDFLKTTGSRELHLRAWETAVRLEVPEHYVWLALVSFAVRGQVRLATWSERLRREVTFQEWAAPAFFNNREDCNYVRLRPHTAADPI
jgi:hypothetical protein